MLGVELGIEYVDPTNSKVYITDSFLNDKTSNCVGVSYYWKGSDPAFRRVHYRTLEDFKTHFQIK